MGEATNAYKSFFCWNIQNPSLERAAKQAEWLRKRNDDVLILTETKASKGCVFLESYFRAYGYQVLFQKPEGKEYGIMIASKHSFKKSSFFNYVDLIPSRVAAIEIEFPSTTLEIIGTYIPSRDATVQKIERKKTFLSAMSRTFHKSPAHPMRLFCGDFNILEPNHEPAYSFFESWEYEFYQSLSGHGLVDAFRSTRPDEAEYSWVGRTGDGYRYDHSFVSKDLHEKLHDCFYLHEPREMRLSDHSAIVTHLSV